MKKYTLESICKGFVLYHKAVIKFATDNRDKYNLKGDGPQAYFTDITDAMKMVSDYARLSSEEQKKLRQSLKENKMKKSRFKEIVKEVLVEENEYQIFFQKALEKAGKSIPQMGTQEKRDFFNKIDSAWRGRGEKKLAGNQSKLDVDKDGEIEASDLEKLRDTKLGEWYKERNPNIPSLLSTTKVDAKTIANKMRKSSTMKSWADRVEKMGKVSHRDLEKTLPDYIAGKDIAGLFESNLRESDSALDKYIWKSGKYAVGTESYDDKDIYILDGGDAKLLNILYRNIDTKEKAKIWKLFWSSSCGICGPKMAIKYAKQHIKKNKVGESVNEDSKKVWKYKGVLLVDSDFVNFCQNKLPNSELKHAGMGNFFLQTPDGMISFDRTNGKLDGMSGRAHQVSDNQGGKLLAQLIKKMGAKFVTESTKSLNESEFGKFPEGITLEKTKEIGIMVAKAIAKLPDVKKASLNLKTLEPGGFDIDEDGVEYDGGSYNLYDNGNIVNHAVTNPKTRKSPIVGNWKTDNVNKIYQNFIKLSKDN